MVFPDLTVEENTELGNPRGNRSEVEAGREQVLEIFPKLLGRLKDPAGVLSGGEQQMVSLARALIGRPQILMLDEPSLGLAPTLLDDLFALIDRIRSPVEIGILLVEQKVDRVLEIADSVVALKLGRVVYAGRATELKRSSENLREIFL